MRTIMFTGAMLVALHWICPLRVSALQLRGAVSGEQALVFRGSRDSVEAYGGAFAVPARRDQTASDSLILRYVRFPATTSTPGSPIVYLAGGPGGSGIAGFAGNRHDFFMGLRDIADVIAFDQRGTGVSEPRDLTCRHEAGFPLDRAGSRDGYLVILAREVARCIDRFHDGDVPLYGLTTAESADDLEALRRHLGVPQLTLLGSSYGTHLALAMARRHPTSIDRMVLAGVEGPDHTLKLPGDVESNLRAAAAVARRDTLYEQLLPDVVSILDSIGEALSDVAQKVEVVNDTIVLGPWDLHEYVASFVGTRASLRRLPAAVYALRRGNWGDFARWVARRRTPGSTNAMSLAMDCASYASPGRLHRIRAEAASSVAGAAIDFPLPEICDVPGLPRLDSPFRAPLERTTPTLLISGSLDGRTPFSNARGVADGLARARHLLIENSGHGADLYVGSPAITDAIRAFLVGEPTPARLALPPLVFDPPVERSLADDVLYRLRRDGYAGSAAWYRQARSQAAGTRTYDFSEEILNRLGYELLRAGLVTLAVDVFRLNVLGYPMGFNAWDSLGEGYARAGETERAIAAYEKSLELEPSNANAVRMLQELRRPR